MKLKLLLPYSIHATCRRIQTTDMPKSLKLASLAQPFVCSLSHRRLYSFSVRVMLLIVGVAMPFDDDAVKREKGKRRAGIGLHHSGFEKGK